MALKAGDLKSIGCIQFSHWKMQKCSGPVEELPQMPGRQSVVVAPDNPVRDLLTQGCAGLLSPASQPSLRCHLLLFQLESVNLYHITPEVRLWSSSHHRKAQLALKVKHFLHLRRETGTNQKCPHTSRTSAGCRSRGECSILL